MVVYSLSQPIRSRILNYKKFVSELDLDGFNENKDSIKCHCFQYDNKFLNNDRKHILTGNLQIIKNNKLRKLFSKGPKYREPAKINFETARETIKSGIEYFIKAFLKLKRKVFTFLNIGSFHYLSLLITKLRNTQTRLGVNLLNLYLMTLTQKLN